MTVPEKRFMLVELEPDLAKHYTTWTGLCALVGTAPGVISVTDLAYVSQGTLDLFLAVDPLERLAAEERSTDEVFQMRFGD